MSLTTADLKAIKTVVNEVIDERVEPRFVSIENAIQTLTTSTAQQFDNIVGQLDRIHEEVAIIKDYVLDHDYRITKLEKRLA